MVALNSSFTGWISHLFDCMGGCFGCCAKPTPIIAVDEPTKGLRIQGRAMKKTCISDDFWSTSTCDLENSAFQSQRSLSSISVSKHILTQSTSTGGTSDFVNHGLLLWNEGRLQWLGASKSKKRTQQIREPQLSWNVTYESLLGTRNPLPRSIPLSMYGSKKVYTIENLKRKQ